VSAAILFCTFSGNSNEIESWHDVKMEKISVARSPDLAIFDPQLFPVLIPVASGSDIFATGDPVMIAFPF